LVSDHMGNLLEEVTGTFPTDKAKLLGIIARFQSMPPESRLHFRVGRRAGVYTSLDDMNDLRKRNTVLGIIERLSNSTGEIDDDLVHQMRLAYT